MHIAPITASIRFTALAAILAVTAACGSSAAPDTSTHDGGASGGDAGATDDASDSAASADSATGDAALGSGTFTSHSFQSRTYKLYVPASYKAGVPFPLVVMLHGCSQNPDDFATGTAMNAYADTHGLLVAYPEQPSSANSLLCWNWFLAGHQTRGAGEPALIAGMVDDVRKAYAVDATRVYAAGISAGGAMSVILGATYPDVFAAIGVSAGLEYAAATNATDGYKASQSGGPDPKTQGDLAFTAMGSVARVVPVIVIQGSADTTVAPVNGPQVIAQWAETDARAGSGVKATPDATDHGTAGGKTFTHTTYDNGPNGAPVLELYVVDTMGHAWAGGNSAATFTDPNAPNATALFGAFFAAHPR